MAYDASCPFPRITLTTARSPSSFLSDVLLSNQHQRLLFQPLHCSVRPACAQRPRQVILRTKPFVSFSLLFEPAPSLPVISCRGNWASCPYVRCSCRYFDFPSVKNCLSQPCRGHGNLCACLRRLWALRPRSSTINLPHMLHSTMLLTVFWIADGSQGLVGRPRSPHGLGVL